MCKFLSKSGGGVPFQPLGDLAWNDPKVIEKCTNFYFGTEKLPPKFKELINIVKKFWACWPQKIVFQLGVWWDSVAKFVTLSVIDDL